MMSPWGWTQMKGLKHVGQWNYTINVIKLYICRTINIKDNIFMWSFKSQINCNILMVLRRFCWWLSEFQNYWYSVNKIPSLKPVMLYTVLQFQSIHYKSYCEYVNVAYVSNQCIQRLLSEYSFVVFFVQYYFIKLIQSVTVICWNHLFGINNL
jgi:hypothetical protein